MSLKCLVCGSPQLLDWPVFAKPQRTYWRCGQCDFLFMNPQEAQVSWEEEKSRYDEHNNTESEGYRRFFEPLRRELRQRVSVKAGPLGLDYGCGPTQYLANLLKEEDAYSNLKVYDVFYAPDASPLIGATYDFIVSTEVFEHFYNPAEEIKKVFSLLKDGGLLFVMTSPPPEVLADFSNWSYRRDTTHVSFYSSRCFKFIANREKGELVYNDRNLWIFKKKG